MNIAIPVVPEAEQTPLIQQLLEILQQQAERIQQQSELIQQLRDEIAALKNLPPKPKITPSKLEQPPPSSPTGAAPDNHKRPGSAKRPKNAQLTIHDDKVLKPDQVPPGSTFKGYED